MAEFQKECDEYGCPPVYVQWQKILKLMLAQTDPKDIKKRQKEVTSAWNTLCEENCWVTEEKKHVPLTPIIFAMEHRLVHRIEIVKAEGKSGLAKGQL